MGKHVFDETTKVLDPAVPLIDRNGVLYVNKELDEEIPQEEMAVFIESAHLIVCEHLDGWGLSLPRLTLIERYLAAHFSSISYPQATFEAAGKIQVSYSVKNAFNLDATLFGQQAKTFDPTGQLRKLSEGKLATTVSIDWGGIVQKEWEASHANN